MATVLSAILFRAGLSSSRLSLWTRGKRRLAQRSLAGVNVLPLLCITLPQHSETYSELCSFSFLSGTRSVFWDDATKNQTIIGCPTPERKLHVCAALVLMQTKWSLGPNGCLLCVAMKSSHFYELTEQDLILKLASKDWKQWVVVLC